MQITGPQPPSSPRSPAGSETETRPAASGPARVRGEAGDGPLQAALRNALPRQLPLSTVLAGLLAASGGSRHPALPAEVLQQMQRLLERLPQREAVTRADGLRQALADSGLFLEARLAEALRAGQPSTQLARQLAGDLKGGLLGLLSLLLGQAGGGKPVPALVHGGETPPPLPHAQPVAQPRVPPPGQPPEGLSLPRQLQQLLRQVDAGIARIQLSQLASIAEDDDGTRHWLLDLPLRDGERIDVLQLRIEQRRKRRESGERGLWSVALALELPDLGPVHARVSLGGGTVSARFWAERDDTARLFDRHLGELQQRLRQAGLEVGQLAAHHGAPPAAESGPALPRTLLDEQA